MIKVDRLNVSFRSETDLKQVLYDVSFDIKKNEFIAIVGESGSGKSVTSKVLMGLLGSKAVVEASQIDFYGQSLINLEKKTWSKIRGKKISMIFQEPMSSLNPTMTCGRQVREIILQHKQASVKEAESEVISLFAKVKLPDPKTTFSKYPHEISGGQMQRVMIAMAIACKPELLIADEPTTALDATVQKDIIELLKSIQQEFGMSVLFISHDLSLVKSIADRIIVMYQGRIVETGSSGEIFNYPTHDYTAALIASRPSADKRLVRLPTVADFLDGKPEGSEVDGNERKESHKRMYSLDPILIANNIVMDYPLKKELFEPQKWFRAVDGIDLEIYPQESLGLVGESGCGKSTLGNILIGLKKPTSGKVIFKGTDLTQIFSKELKTIRKHIQIIFQDPFSSLNPRISVGNAIMEPMKVHGIGMSHQDRKQRVYTLLEKVGLSKDSFGKYPHEFSGGQRQRIGIARTIALEPQLIVCDESVSALDISVQAQVLNLLNDLKQDFNFSYLFISHDLAVVKYFCDRTVVMNNGRIEEIQESDSLYKNPKSDYTKKLLEAANL
jgi:peptide/nickel transport system ATP-binding protein